MKDNLSLDMKKNNWILFLFFFPIYFTVNGIYKIEVMDNFTRGLILPFTFMLGMYCLIYIFFDFIKNQKKIKYNSIFMDIIVIFYLILINTIIGYLIYNQKTSFILILQYITGILGLFIAIYIYSYKKMDIEKIFYNISKVFLVAILLNLIYSTYKIGIIETFSRNILFATPFGGIYHGYVYYPYIVTMIFLFALPIWDNNSILVWPIYFLITIYILVIQVRGAILSYLLGFIGYFLFFREKPRNRNILILILIFLLIINIVPLDKLLGRFKYTSSTVLSGRESVWGRYINNIKNNTIYIFTGSFGKASTPELFSGNIREKGVGHSYHNQYIELLDSYGCIILLYFLFIILKYLISLILLNKKKDKNHKKRNNYWFFLVVVQLIIDMNTNVPLRVTNPAIMIYFYWTTLYLEMNSEEQPCQKQKL